MNTSEIKQFIDKINTIAYEYHRDPQQIKIIAVSKGQPISALIDAYQAGITDFGENYWQEAQKKMAGLEDYPLCWHYIGPIQSNKAGEITKHFSWVHSVGRLKIANILSQQRPDNLPLLNVCLQVNLDDEESKSGVAVAELAALLKEVIKLPRLQVRGLMTIPRPCLDEDMQFAGLIRLKILLEELNDQFGLNMDSLSMGMSDDYRAAIRAGSTMLRIGRAIFGERQ